MTNDEAVALALYDLSEQILREAKCLKIGSGARRTAEDIGSRVYRRAKALDLGESDDAAVQRSGDALRRNILERAARADQARAAG
jgi:hypothetical protein